MHLSIYSCLRLTVHTVYNCEIKLTEDIDGGIWLQYGGWGRKWTLHLVLFTSGLLKCASIYEVKLISICSHREDGKC